jgi:hypothetical protein
VPGADFLRLWRKAEKPVELAVDKELQRVDLGIGRRHPVDVLGRIEPHPRGHQDQQRRRAGIEADGLALQLGDVANVVAREEFVAADMDTAEHDNRRAGVDRVEKIERAGGAEIELAAADRLAYGGGIGLDIADVIKALGPQQLLGGILRRKAHGRNLGEADCRGFRSWIGCPRALRQ